MAPRLFKKAKSKARKLLQTAPLESSTPPSATNTFANIVSAGIPTSSSTDISANAFSTDLDGSRHLAPAEPTRATLERGLGWILSAKLHGDDPSFATRESTDSEIGETPRTRCGQMQQLVQAGLDRTQKQASIKQGIDEGLQAVQEVRRIVDKALHAAPEAAVAWVGVCLGLEILSNPIAEARDNRKGIAYVLSRMEWYWNLVSLLLDENKAEQSSAGLRVQLEKHVVQLYEKLLTYQIKSVCLYYRNWAAIIGRDLLKIDDWASQ
ncbi:hypothetical protein FPOA_13172 [Fusarium poae]|uniref:NWD NACHT-NTPase N-terminal domain-containing protein n=1 Tax=Fusarium poae TaxID=36050 RepID=A0A1B8A6H7_FUSPO|nr:hypothetical protein FPOA_13172 [Fusarium poae]